MCFLYCKALLRRACATSGGLVRSCTGKAHHSLYVFSTCTTREAVTRKRIFKPFRDKLSVRWEWRLRKKPWMTMSFSNSRVVSVLFGAIRRYEINMQCLRSTYMSKLTPYLERLGISVIFNEACCVTWAQIKRTANLNKHITTVCNSYGFWGYEANVIWNIVQNSFGSGLRMAI